jgi:DNA processing protein
MSAIKYWLALKQVPRLSLKAKLALVEHYGLEALFGLSPSDLAAHKLTSNQIKAITSPDWRFIDQVLSQSEAINSQIITFEDSHYPDLLKETHSPPLVLFVKGDIGLLTTKQLAIVGSRSPTLAGKEFAKELACNLASYQLTITSGLALGIDAAAHRGALNGLGKTIAVVATGLDRVYPSRHKALAMEILEQGGAWVSEFLPGTSPKPGHFPRRNRLISGLSLGVLVVEAAIKSGSLVTAYHALEQNREIFAVPGSIHNPVAKGCHQLIKQGAKLVDEVADIVDELDLPLTSGHILQEQENLTKTAQPGLLNDALLDSVDYETTPVDMVVSRSKLPIDVVLTRLTILELSGLVSAVPGGYIRLNRG